MRQLLQKILPENDFTRKCLAIGVTVLLAGLLTLWGIYQIGEYGVALFMVTPLFIGAAPGILYGIKKEISSAEARNIALLSLLVFTLALIIFAIEGLLCIAMAAPIGLFFTWIFLADSIAKTNEKV